MNKRTIKSITFSERVLAKIEKHRKEKQQVQDKALERLITLGKLRKQERELTQQLFDYGMELEHECIKEEGDFTQLQNFFDGRKPLREEHREEYLPLWARKSLQTYVDYLGEPLCPQCVQVYNVIQERRSVRRSLAVIRGHISRLADRVMELELDQY
jgi:hypothetical protein